MNINEILKSNYDLLCNDYKKATKKIEKQDKEIERLHSIIKEAREYVNVELLSSNADYYRKNGGYVSGSDLDVDCIFPILDILDKVNK